MPEFAEQIAAKRDELYAAFPARRDQLAASGPPGSTAVASARRVLQTVADRAPAADLEEIDGFFAADPLVAGCARRPRAAELGEAGRAAELEAELGAAKDTARRAVGDRSELFSDGSVRIGSQIGVNTSPSSCACRGANGRTAPDLELRLTGTDLVRRSRPTRCRPSATAAQSTPPRTPCSPGPCTSPSAATRTASAADALADARRAGSTTATRWASTTPTPRRSWPPRHRCGAPGPAAWRRGPGAGAGGGGAGRRRATTSSPPSWRRSGRSGAGRARRAPSWPSSRRAVADGRRGEGLDAVDGAEAAGDLIAHGDRLAVRSRPTPGRPASAAWAGASGIDLAGASLGDVAATSATSVPSIADGGCR